MTRTADQTETLRQGVNDEMADLWVAAERLLTANDAIRHAYGWDDLTASFRRRAERLANQLLNDDDLEDTVLDLAATLVVYRAALTGAPVPYSVKED